MSRMSAFDSFLTPLKADENEENTMSIVEIALLINALSSLITAVAKVVEVLRR